jgi:hypothetical protein
VFSKEMFNHTGIDTAFSFNEQCAIIAGGFTISMFLILLLTACLFHMFPENLQLFPDFNWKEGIPCLLGKWCCYKCCPRQCWKEFGCCCTCSLKESVEQIERELWEEEEAAAAALRAAAQPPPPSFQPAAIKSE